MARAAGKANGGLTDAQNFQRKAQFSLDFVEAEHSTSFHAPQEAVWILGEFCCVSGCGTVRVRENFVGAVVAASATLQTLGGLDVLLLGAEKLLRRNPRFVTCGFTMLCGTATWPTRCCRSSTLLTKPQ